MKINKSDKAPVVVTDVSGRIMLASAEAKRELKFLKSGENINKIIDANVLTKLSMKSKVLEIVPIDCPCYDVAILKVEGQGLSKTVKVSFHKSSEGLDATSEEDRDIITSVNDIDFDKRIESVNLKKLANEAIEELKNTSASYPFVNLYVDDIDMSLKSLQLQALIICSLSMMHETSPKRPVDLYLRKKNGKLEVKVIVRVDDYIRLYGAQAIEKTYPWTAIRFALIDDICERDKIQYKATVTEKALKIVFHIQEKEAAQTELYSQEFYFELLQEISCRLKPRQSILLKHTKEAIEE